MAQHTAVAVYGSLDEAVAALKSLGSDLPFALFGGAEEGMAGPRPAVAGWLFQLGLSSEVVLKYDGAVKAGKFLVVVHGSAATARRGHDALAGGRAEQLDLHAPAAS